MRHTSTCPKIENAALRRFGSPKTEHGPAEGHTCLAKLAQGTVCNILNEQEVKPHKVRYYLERRDPEFKQKMAEVLCVYREVRLIKETAACQCRTPSGSRPRTPAGLRRRRR